MKNNHPKITTHSLVKNESKWIWYSLMSVIDYVDEMLVWDTGSTDNTVEIIKSINHPKIKFREYGEVDSYTFTKAHNEMISITNTDWMMILDGDEIWPYSAIENLSRSIYKFGDKYDFFVRHHYNLLGDVYHYQEELGGRYQLGPHSGHYAFRAVNLARNPGLHFEKPHGQIGLFDADGSLIQDRPGSRFKLLPGSFFHMTHLQRSVDKKLDRQVIKRAPKFKYELGRKFPDTFKYPEVFYLPRPTFVNSPWNDRSLGYTLNAFWQTPLKLVKRRIFPSSSSGY